MKTLNKIQKQLRVPKGQVNSFGGFKYRSCEDILEAVKPLLDDCTLLLDDEIVQIGTRYYIKATAKFIEGENVTTVSAFAREPESKTKMDDAQVTGSSSSYARKYALNGLFLIDDIKDPDTMDNSAKGQNKPNKPKETANVDAFLADIQPTDEEIIIWKEKLESAKDLKELKSFWAVVPPMVQDKLAKVKDELKQKLS